MGEHLADMGLTSRVLVLLALCAQSTNAVKYIVQVSGATDNPAQPADDGGLLCNGRYRWNGVTNSKNSYTHSVSGCTITHNPTSSLNGGGAAWVIGCTGED